MESVDESKLNYKRLDQSVKRLVIQSLAAILNLSNNVFSPLS